MSNNSDKKKFSEPEQIYLILKYGGIVISKSEDFIKMILILFKINITVVILLKLKINNYHCYVYCIYCGN